jgi:hypothetical protein
MRSWWLPELLSYLAIMISLAAIALVIFQKQAVAWLDEHFGATPTSAIQQTQPQQTKPQ